MHSSKVRYSWFVVCLAVLLVISWSAPAAAASIVPRTPVANENLEIGVPTLITWEYSGLGVSDKIKIVLMRDQIELGTIVENIYALPNPRNPWSSGSYVWKTGTYKEGKLANIGTGYSVKIQSSNNLVSGVGGKFTLSVKPPPPPPIGIGSPVGPQGGLPIKTVFPKVTNPKAGGSIPQYGAFNVTWIGIGKMDQKVSVTLLWKGAVYITLAAAIPNNGTFNWVMNPSLGLWQGLYTLRVRTLDGRVEAFSGEFTLEGLIN